MFYGSQSSHVWKHTLSLSVSLVHSRIARAQHKIGLVLEPLPLHASCVIVASDIEPFL